MVRNGGLVKRLVSTISTSMIGLILGTCIFSPLAIADQGDPNGADNRTEPGWGLWFPRSQVEGAGFDSGFSNSELGGFMDFEAACASATRLPNQEIDYWFRLTTSVPRIGTGSVEFGCWQDGRFVNTYRSQAVHSSSDPVTCLYVRSNTGNGLNIRAEPSMRSRVLRTVRNGSRVTPSAFPAIIRENEVRNLVEIRSPIRGWVSDDRPTSQGNLVMCYR